MLRPAMFFAVAALLAPSQASAADDRAELGPRPFFLVDRLEDGPLKNALQACDGPFVKTDFSIGHRGAPMQFPEHTEESYRAAARMGAGIVECDVTFTKDHELVCRHSQCDLHTTTDILTIPELASQCSAPFTPANPATGKKASAKCCASDISLAQFRRLTAKMDGADRNATTIEDYLVGTPGWRTDLYAAPGALMTHAESVSLFKELGVKMTPELKAPETTMPHNGFSLDDYRRKIIEEYRAADVPASDVFLQSFNLEDVKFWIDNEPDFARQAVFLDGRSGDEFDPDDPDTFSPSMDELAATGLNYIAPPLWMLLTTNDDGAITASAYATAARQAGLTIIAWTLERSGPLDQGGGWYYQSVTDAIDGDGDMLTVLDILGREVGIAGVFSDWPATTTFYANCMLAKD